jgi:menaquinone-specific isochorismate synthase
MITLPVDPVTNATPGALRSFLEACRDAAIRDGCPKLASISIAVDALDPLAVLEAIFEREQLHFYAERPALDTAIAGAEAVASLETRGPDRFAKVQGFVDTMVANTIAVGDVTAPFGGPHFFTAFAFHDEVGKDEPFPSARVFVPRWQVARAGDRTTAVANVLVDPDTPLDQAAEKIWRAHQKFRAFDYDSNRPGGLQPMEKMQWETTDQGDYLGAVRGALRQIERGEFQKIVLARCRAIRASGSLHPLQLLNGLRQRFPDCYAFSVANGRGQSFIGASPERLVRLSSGIMETEAMAGSAPRGRTAMEDAAYGAALLRSEKDRHEHQLVLDSICRRLAPLRLTLEFASEPTLRKLANVQHLRTGVRANLPDGVHLLDILSRLHPTPAVGGSPRAAAVARIAEHEGFSRGLYAGALGWINCRGGGEFLVGLRSALVDGKEARLFAGAGVVAGSSPEKELLETELKFQAMEAALKGQ